MKLQHAFIALVVLNLAFLGFQIAHGGADKAENVPQMIRARGFELVDDQGRVRAELKITAAQPDLKMPDGTKEFPESVLFRLIDSGGGPNVKISATEDGSGMVLGGEKTYVQILSRGSADPFVKIATKDGQEKVFKP